MVKYLKLENEIITDITPNKNTETEIKKYGENYVLYIKLISETVKKRSAHIYVSLSKNGYIHWNGIELLVWNDNIVIDDVIYDDWTRELKIWFHKVN